MKNLWCDNNNLTSLDVSTNTALDYLHYDDNRYIIIVNSDRTFDLSTLPGSFDVNKASGWTGGEVNGTILTVNAVPSQVTYTYDCGNGQSATFTLLADSTTEGIAINETNFPDRIFRAVASRFDADINGKLSPAEIAAITELEFGNMLIPQHYDISSLKGIEYFTALTDLDCSNSKLTSLDVSKNTELTQLRCRGNNLTSLDISGNTKLMRLECDFNKLTSLDLSNNPALEYLDCQSNNLTELDVSNNHELTRLGCGHNRLTELDVSSNPKLTSLDCFACLLTSLDVSGNPELLYFGCDNNQYVITADTAVRTFDLSTLPGGFDVSRASGWTGGTASGNTLTIDDGASQVTYTYDCGGGKTAMFTLLVNFGSHTHVYGDWSKDADSHWKECNDAVCPDKTGSVKDKAAHEFEWKVDQAATAEAPGLKHEECKICGYRRSENTVINPDSHTHVYGDWSKDADNHWKECGDAACPDKTGSVKDKAAHEFEWKVDQAATAEAPGLKHEECKICGYRRSENTVIDKLPSTNPPSGGGGGSSSGGGSSAPSVTVPVSGESNTVDVSVSVSGSTATVIQIDTTQINSVVKDGGKADAVEIDFTGLGKSIETVKLPTAAIKDIAEAAQKGETGGLTVKLSDGEVSFDADALSAIQSQAGSQITLTLTPAKPADLSPRQKEAVGNAPVYDLTLKSDSGAITDFKGGYATVSLPYTLKAGEDPTGIVVYYLDNNGNITPCKTMYDVRSKSVIFTTGHFSVYFVGYDPTAVWENPFSDMSGDAYYAEAVKWAVLNGVTSGTSANTFSPDASCTRAQMAVFLWNAAGKPEPRSKITPFSDVKGDEWYGKAVFWAAENGIASGLDGGRFAPNDPCTRAQMTAFLFRYAKAEKANASNPFADVKKDAWYYDDVMWAVKEEITAGTSATTFEPESVCTRAQMVTFLYRLLGK